MNIQEMLSGIESNPALQDAAGRAGLDPSQAQTILQGVIEHASGGGGLEGVAEAVAARAGVDPAQVQQFLPSVMGLLQSHADGAPEGAQDMLGGLMGSLRNSPLGGLLSSGQGGGSIAGEAMGIAKGLFGGQ